MRAEPIVFISYTHDSETHKACVLQLANRLRDEGIDCHLDRYETSPPEGWARWMTNQVKRADFVLVVCTETYERRFEGNEMIGKGLGAQWEGMVITQELYDAAARNTKFIPVVFAANDSSFIPIIVKSATFYRVDTEEGYEDLYRRLTAQPRVVKPPLGKKRVLSEGGHQPLSQTPRIQQTNEKTIQSSSFEHQSNQNLFLIYLEDDTREFIPASQATVEENTIEVCLRPENSKQKAFLAELAGRNKTDFAIAYKDDAYLVKLEKSIRVHEQADEWRLILKQTENNRSSVLMEYSLNGYTGDDFAELRARRILFNEQAAPRNLWQRGSNNLGLIEHTVKRGNSFIKEIYCPITMMRQEYPRNDALFLATA